MSGVELAIVASGRSALCASRLGDGRILEAPIDSRGAPRGDLAATVDAMFRVVGLAPEALTAIRLDVGPGSYTGLRIAVTFARTIAAFRGLPLRAVTSFELAAHAAWSRGGVPALSAIQCVLDARRTRYHVATLERDARRVQLVGAPRAVEEDELSGFIRADAVVLAEAALHGRLRDRCSVLGPRLAVPTPVRAADLFDAAIDAREVAPGAIEPLYLMGTYADD